MPRTAEDIAKWMMEQVEKGSLYQQVVVDQLKEPFMYYNDNGNPAISREVLRAFKKLGGGRIVWDWFEKAWRKRRKGDAPGRA